MSEKDTDQAGSDEEKSSADLPELSEEGREQVKQMQAAYNDDRQTAVLPGTDGTITGVAINEWLDEDGNPKFGKDKQKEKDEKAEHQDDDQHQKKEKQEQHAD